MNASVHLRFIISLCSANPVVRRLEHTHCNTIYRVSARTPTDMVLSRLGIHPGEPNRRLSTEEAAEATACDEAEEAEDEESESEEEPDPGFDHRNFDKIGDKGLPDDVL